jgi:hypothetical protein
MDRGHREHGSKPHEAGPVGRPTTGPWIERGREPPLEELLDDPMMALLWRRDRLQPEAARAEVQALRALVGGRDDGGLPPG